MLEIQRLKIIIKTIEGDFGFDKNFKKGLNFIASQNNTSGKSSIINGIYYALGLEEIIGGRGSKTLSYVYKDSIKDDNNRELPILESEIQLQISNGNETITLRRRVKNENIKENLITIYFSTINEMFSKDTNNIDTYVHLNNAAILKDGFHFYLEKFLSLNLPMVPGTNSSDIKLYLQTIFSAMFIEQKRGWTGIMSGMPIYGISDIRKRIVEFLIGLETLANEHKKKDVANKKESITREWITLVNEIKQLCNQNLLEVVNLFMEPQTVSSDEIASLSLLKEGKTIETYLNSINEKITAISSTIPIINNENRDKLQENLRLIESQVSEKELEITTATTKRELAKFEYNRLNQNFKIIQKDLQDNKELRKLKKLGSKQWLKSFDDMCPICGQHLQDSLLASETFMNIDENIKHLESQEVLLDFAIKSQKENIDLVDIEIHAAKNALNDLRRLMSVVKLDLVKVKEDYSETNIFEKIKLTNEKERLELVKTTILEKAKNFENLSQRWNVYLNEKEILPKDHFTSSDEQKLETLKQEFIKLLKDVGYNSALNLDEVSISKITFLPEVKGFGMKFDSSASDNIRTIWAFALALLKTSLSHNGNHQKLFICDEPKQQNIVDSDFKVLFKKIIELGDKIQTIIGLTVKDEGIINIINSLEKNSYNYIDIGNKGFIKFVN